VLPGLVDCHTHLVFGGWRSDEFAMRIEGRSYLEIARAGGGIASTMRHTRAASEEALTKRALGFLDGMVQLGVTTVEAKSGYGLTLEHELRLLRAARAAGEAHAIDVVPTLLGAHIVPPEHREDREAYVRLVIDEMIPAAVGLADFCDVFVEDTAFTPDEARRIFAAATAHGLRPRLHADQITDTGGAALAAEVGAVSADHLECASDAGLRAMADAGVVAVVLPLAALYTFSEHTDGRRLRAAGVDVAVASDFNPGSAPSGHLPLALMLSCTMSRLTPAQALRGATVVAARVVGRDDIGTLAVGKRADLAVIGPSTVDHWLYHFTGAPAVATVKGGTFVHGDIPRIR
jgi:imidazolonepropionase